MSLLLEEQRPTAPRPPAPEAARLRPLSVIPGRQRWHVDVVGRDPAVARLLEELLLAGTGIQRARANPVTGRVLVVHDPAIPSAQVATVLGEAVGRAVFAAHGSGAGRRREHTSGPGTSTPAAPGRAETAPAPAALPSSEKDGAPDRTTAPGPRTSSPGPLVRGAVGAIAVGCAWLCRKLLTRPLVGLGVALTATAAVVKRASGRSTAQDTPHTDVHEAADESTGRHPLLRMLGPHRRMAAWACLLSTIGQIVEAAVFVLIAAGVLLLANGGNATLAQLGITAFPGQLAFLAGATALVCLASSALNYSATAAWHDVGHEVEHDWRVRTHAHAQRLPMAYLEDERTHHIASVLSDDIGQIGPFLGNAPHEAVQLATSIALLVPVFCFMAPQLAWIAFAPIPLMAWLSYRHYDRAVNEQAVANERRTGMSGRISETLQAAITVKSSCTETHEDERLADLSLQYTEANKRTDRGTAAQGLIVRACAMAALPTVLLFGGMAVFSGQMSAAVVTPLIEMPGLALYRLSRLGAVTDQYQRALAAFGRVERTNQLPIEPATGRDELPAVPLTGPVTGRIDLRDVTFSYPGRPPVISNLSLEVPAGRTTAIVGVTGAGKSTIAKLLLRLRDRDDGLILLDGVDVNDLSLQDLRRTIGYVGQDPYLFDTTIGDNIRYGAFDASDDQVTAAARIAGAHDFVQALPLGYRTPVGERGAALSGGQRQRVSLARTILRDPPVVILDEATSAVDNETEAAIQRALNAFGHQRTMLVIAHRLSTVRDADLIYVLDSGGVPAERGTHQELVQQGGLYANLWKLQAGEQTRRTTARKAGKKAASRPAKPAVES
ncbi:ABC transporter ATP-binding protein [Streptomyces paludis]|uniref:Fatty acid ABC transporter ATP-binding/permease protein n=1 Tax=Streptomyces paludis TaxID=2282738 RepID=A0A345HJ89_9ACTN|nr:ABC transporter ATP-binding protein [Streptomyces paludis]AXG76763.1 ATP-binding cassette domain-containing protein [Streptomyces paludis]